jgi:hypothetical protein
MSLCDTQKQCKSVFSFVSVFSFSPRRQQSFNPVTGWRPKYNQNKVCRNQPMTYFQTLLDVAKN